MYGRALPMAESSVRNSRVALTYSLPTMRPASVGRGHWRAGRIGVQPVSSTGSATAVKGVIAHVTRCNFTPEVLGSTRAAGGIIGGSRERRSRRSPDTAARDYPRRSRTRWRSTFGAPESGRHTRRAGSRTSCDGLSKTSAEPSIWITDTVADVPERLLPRARPTGTSGRCPMRKGPRVRGHFETLLPRPSPSLGIQAATRTLRQ